MDTAFQLFLASWLLFILALCAVGVIALIAGAIWMYGDAQRRRMDASLWVIILILGTVFGAGIVGFAIVLLIEVADQARGGVETGILVPSHGVRPSSCRVEP